MHVVEMCCVDHLLWTMNIPRPYNLLLSCIRGNYPHGRRPTWHSPPPTTQLKPTYLIPLEWFRLPFTWLVCVTCATRAGISFSFLSKCVPLFNLRVSVCQRVCTKNKARACECVVCMFTVTFPLKVAMYISFSRPTLVFCIPMNRQCNSDFLGCHP